MLLIADSGSTKTSWRLIDGTNPARNFSTVGYNPHYLQTDEIQKSLTDTLLIQLGFSPTLVKEVHFYGAGCSSKRENKTVRDALNEVFPKSKNNVDHDLLAAARAACGREAGIACILGTGSNSCSYNGKDIIDGVPSLGFIMGDEGSGAQLGRLLLKAFFYREMPTDIKAVFDKEYGLTKDEMISKVYHESMPSRYVAQFSRFYTDHKEHPFIQKLLHKNFHEFLTRHVVKYENCQQLPIHYIGSIAFYFRDVLETVMNELNLKPGRFIRNPLDRLEEYHREEY